ncbi:LysR family transcriptional regulator [Salinisphaera sp.]|uniref:LysR family transcriptional regulator n=1 Tax=Salinisphaera sp. TaxID=1914330 RepID=UPI000C51D648|nr:LysR family transcriptional regulator [Salinisphaera sp.]MAS10280.1 LysR family transcriptional regulator [Salinisphaera sp.]|tara:strand:- start:1848 stop:2789 length:942 start_codon:yes stop_codon:yes gene_type:complete
MNITLRQLKVFEAVARHASYTRAAEELHLTQPAVSIQVKSLEEAIGLALFEQFGKQIYLTTAGEEILRYSRGIAAQIDEIGDVVARLKGVSRGSLYVAVATTANYFITHLLAAFHREFPEVSINLSVTNRQALLKQLAENRVDLVVMGEPPPDQGLAGTAFMDNPLVVIAPPDHPLGQRKRIPLKTIAKQPFVVREEGSGTRAAMTRFARRHQIAFTPAMVMTSNEAIKQAVGAGLGLGLVSAHTLELDLYAERLQILDVAHFPIMREWYVVNREGKRLSPAAEAFKQFLVDHADTVWPTATKAAGAVAGESG